MSWGFAFLVLAWVLLALVVLATAAWCSWTATRLDRLHLRYDAARAAMRAELLQRSAVAVELAAGELSDPASALVVLDAAHAARESEGAGDPEASWMRESDLTRALHAVQLPDPEQDALVNELRTAARRASMARRICNDLVGTTLALRERRRVRWFRLAGHAPPPAMVDFDDRVP